MLDVILPRVFRGPLVTEGLPEELNQEAGLQRRFLLAQHAVEFQLGPVFDDLEGPVLLLALMDQLLGLVGQESSEDEAGFGAAADARTVPPAGCRCWIASCACP